MKLEMLFCSLLMAASLTACKSDRDEQLILTSSGEQPKIASSGVVVTAQTRGGDLLRVRVVGGTHTRASGDPKTAESCTLLHEATDANAAAADEEAPFVTTRFVVYPTESECVVFAELMSGDCDEAKTLRSVVIAVSPAVPGTAGATTSSPETGSEPR